MAPTPLPPPALNIPESQSTVEVHIIDSSARIRGISSSLFLEPAIKGFDTLDCPAYSFLVEHAATGRKVLFDLGVRKDWQHADPRTAQRIQSRGWSVSVEKGVADILSGGDVKLHDIEAIIWR